MATPFLDLTTLTSASQANSATLVNDALNTLSWAAGGMPVVGTATAPPGGESDGDAYLIVGTATGVFVGLEDSIALYFSGWKYITEYEGMTIYDQAANFHKFYNGSAWATLTH